MEFILFLRVLRKRKRPVVIEIYVPHLYLKSQENVSGSSRWRVKTSCTLSICCLRNAHDSKEKGRAVRGLFENLQVDHSLQSPPPPLHKYAQKPCPALSVQSPLTWVWELKSALQRLWYFKFAGMARETTTEISQLHDYCQWSDSFAQNALLIMRSTWEQAIAVS